MTIDATGDGDLAAAAGVPFEKRETSNLQPATLVFRLSNVDINEIRSHVKTHPESISIYPNWKGLRSWKPEYFLNTSRFILVGFSKIVREAKEKRELRVPQDYVIIITLPREGEVAVNMAKVLCDGTNSLDLSCAEIEGRRKVIEVTNFLRKYVPGFADSYLIDTAHSIAIRETRRIVCKYTLTEDDVIRDKRFDDGIAMCGYWMDVHNIDGSWQTFRGGPEKGFHIPYRCLLPKRTENLLVAGRSISATPMHKEQLE